MKEWLTLVFGRAVVARGLKVAVIVSTILVAINQGDAIISGNLSAATAWKISLTYLVGLLVPYCVSTYAGVSAIIAHREKTPTS